MPLDMESVKELKQKIKLARNKELNFALALGKKPEDCALMIHKERGGDKLLLQVKKVDGVQPQKSCYGTMAVDGQLLKLTCLTDPPAGLVKNFRVFFRSNGIPMKLAVLAPGGAVIEADAEETAEAETPEMPGTAAKPQAETDPAEENTAQEAEPATSTGASAATGQTDRDGALPAALKARIQALQTAIAPLEGAIQAKLSEGLKRVLALVTQGQQPKADALMAQLEKALQKIAAATAAPESETGGETGGETGDDTETDPLQARWQATAAKLEPHVARVLDAGAGDLEKIRALWSYAQDKAKAAGFGAALKALGPLSVLLSQAAEAAKSAAQDSLAKGDDTAQAATSWTAVEAKYAPLVAAMVAASDPRSAKVKAAWDMALKSAAAADFDTANMIVGRLRSVLEVPAPAAAPASGKLKEDQPPAEDPAKTKAIDKIDAARAVLTRVEGLITAFGTPKPGDWDKPMAEAAKLLEIETDKEADIEVAVLEAAAKGATDLLAELEPRVKQLSLDKQAWDTQKPLFTARLVPIQAHALKGVDPVKTKLKALADEIKAAEADATGFDFTGAAGRIGAFLTQADLLEALADDFAHYRKIQMNRTILVTPKRGLAAPRAPVQAAITALLEAYDKGVQKAADEKYEEAVSLMNAVPKLHQKVELLLDRAIEVDGDPADATKKGSLRNLLSWLTALNGLDASVKAMLQAGIDRSQAAYDASLPAAEPNVVKAAEKLSLAIRECRDLWARGKKARDYVALRALFDTQLRDFKAHAGHAGIEDVITRMDNDSASAASDAVLRKFDSATRILDASQGDWPAYKLRADDYLAYKTKRDAVEARLKELRKDPQASSAVDELAVCDGHLAQASTLGAARDYKSALDSATAADAAADVAKTLIEMRAEMAKLQKDDVLAAVDKDVVAAFKNYEELAKYVEGKDDGTFATLRAKAATEAQKGRDASIGASPDLDGVRAALTAAIAALEGVAEQIACKAGFTSQRAAIRPAVETELKDGSTANDNCLTSDLQAIDALLTAADDAVKSPGFDFATGLTKVNEAVSKVQDGRKKLALYVEAKPLKTQLDAAERRLKRSRDRALTFTSPIDAKESLQIEIDKVAGFRTAFDTDWAAGKYRACTAKLKADAKRAQAYEASRADYVKAIEWRQKYILDRENLIAADPLVAAERAEVATALAQIETLLESRAFKPVTNLVGVAYRAINRGRDLLAARTAYDGKRAATEAKVQEAEAETAKVASNADLTAEAAALRQRYADAHDTTAVPGRSFAIAGPAMDQLATECQPVIDAARGYKLFDDARKLAAEKIAEVKIPENASLIAPLIARLDGKYANAVDLAAKGHMNQAKALVDALPQDCAAALVAAKNNAALTGIGKDLEAIGEDETPEITQAITAAVEKLRAVFDDLRWESEAQYAKSHDGAENRVEAVETLLKTDPKAAKAALPAALQACTALQVEIGHHKQLDALATRVIGRITGVTAPFVKYAIIQEDADALKAAVTAALKSAQGGGDLAAASAAIEAVMDRHHALMIMARRHDQAIQDRDALEAQHKTLLGSEHRYAIREDLERLAALLEHAGDAAQKRDHDAAEADIEAAKDLAVDATAKDKMAANVAPDAKNIKSILERPDGDKQLDEMIRGLDASVQRKVLRVAFEAKYGCDLNIYVEAKDKAADRHAVGNIVADGSKKGPNIRRLYEVMSVLPPKDTRDNTSMAIFGYEDVETQKGSYYSGGPKEVVMREGNANLSSVYGFGRPHEVGEVDANCEPTDREQVDFFSWNTLHEAGHAVDDQRSFMTGVAGNAAYGGWQEHGGNVKPVADALAGHYKYDATYVAQYVGGNANPALPECPDAVDPEDWERRRSKVQAHVDLARSKNNPWQSAAIATKLNVGGRVYHESYDGGSWNSYDFAARKQAITGYQFRAPGEWFSELYAAYHSKKLKEQHPAVDWLKTLT